VVRFSSLLDPTSIYFQNDITKSTTPPAVTQYLIYDTLLRAQPDGGYSPGLAKSATVVDSQTIKISLQSGVTFSDGTVFDAGALKLNIDRNVKANNTKSFDIALQDVDSVTVDSPLAVTIKLKKPTAGVFYTLLSRGETMSASPTAIQNGVDLVTKPVGAGPFVLESAVSQDKIRLVKNTKYFQADQIKVAAIEYIHTASEAATLNALRTNAVDAADNISPSLVKGLQGTTLTVQNTGSESVLFWGFMCKKNPPLNDVRVRQALNYGLDRDAINSVVFEGKSEASWGFWKSDSKYHDPKLTDFYKRDVTKAKQLLADAGYPNGFDLNLVVPTAGGTAVTVTEIVQAQLKDIGVRVRVSPSANTTQDFFTDAKYPVMFFAYSRAGIDKVTRSLYSPGPIGNICNYNNSEINSLTDQIKAFDPASPQAIQLWKQLDRVALTDAAMLYGTFGTVGTAYNGAKVGGVSYFLDFKGVPYVSPWGLYVKA
jgi:peptide/nickel transport system substrate-binding protein